MYTDYKTRTLVIMYMTSDNQCEIENISVELYKRRLYREHSI